MANTFVKRFTANHQREITGFTERAIEALLSYEWPGNIRELENVIERGVIMAPEAGAIDISHLFTYDEEVNLRALRLGDASSSTDALSTFEPIFDLIEASDCSLDSIEDDIVHEALRKSNGNVSKAARMLRISRARLDYRLKKT